MLHNRSQCSVLNTMDSVATPIVISGDAQARLLVPRQGREGTVPAKPDLDQYRTTVKRLFLDENRSLDEVMQIMANEYGIFTS